MGSAEGQGHFAGSLRVSLRYKFFPLPFGKLRAGSGQEGGQGIGRPPTVDSAPC